MEYATPILQPDTGNKVRHDSQAIILFEIITINRSLCVDISMETKEKEEKFSSQIPVFLNNQQVQYELQYNC